MAIPSGQVKNKAPMKQLSLLFMLALADFAAGRAPAPSAAPDAAGAAPVQSEMQKWFEALDAQWQGTFRQEVTSRFEADLAKLGQQYLATIDANFAKASSTGNLEATLVWRTERERFTAAQNLPAQDLESDAAALKAAR